MAHPLGAMRRVALQLKRVESLLELLALQACADTPVEKVSGGERKRTCIGIELVTRPGLLFLDEPTSGLDSFTALAVMRVIRRTSRQEAPHAWPLGPGLCPLAPLPLLRPGPLAAF